MIEVKFINLSGSIIIPKWMCIKFVMDTGRIPISVIGVLLKKKKVLGSHRDKCRIINDITSKIAPKIGLKGYFRGVKTRRKTKTSINYAYGSSWRRRKGSRECDFRRVFLKQVNL